MSEKRLSLYERLPEIYRIEDAEQRPPYQLKNYVGLVEEIFSEIHENIESLYHDFFIETCEEWVIPYIGDLLGTSHLKGNPWTLRADVADTIALRRRKGTLGAIELLTYNLTQWGVHAIELRDNLVWAQHLNHQRPDARGKPPYSLPYVNLHTPIRGGTIPLRAPSMLSLLNTPFDPYAHMPDLKKAEWGNIRYNLPNLAIFLWCLEAYTIVVSPPKAAALPPDNKPFYKYLYKDKDGATQDLYGVRFFIHPLAEPVRLFNANRYFRGKKPLLSEIDGVTQIDEAPHPMHPTRLTTNSPGGHPESYVSIDVYDPSGFDTVSGGFPTIDIGDVGLQLHVPKTQFNDNFPWKYRGANLCAWEKGLDRPLKKFEIAIDPVIGRLIVSVATEDQKNALLKDMLLTYTYGAVGPVGAHPVSRQAVSKLWQDKDVKNKTVNYHADKNALKEALKNINNENNPVVIEIQDSMVHVLDLTGLSGIVVEDGGPNLQLKKQLLIRAKAGQRPIIQLKMPLRFRPADVSANLEKLTVRLEGLYITRHESFPADEPLIARAALNSLELCDCTLDPGGNKLPNGTRTKIHKALRLKKGYGFGGSSSFNQTPEIILKRTITGPLLIDNVYTLVLKDTIIDAGHGVGAVLNNDEEDYALTSATETEPLEKWGPPTKVSGLTVFGRMRIKRLSGSGGIWVHALEVWNNQKGCIKFSYFSGQGDRLPQHHASVFGTDAKLSFWSECFGNPAYGQLSRTCDYRIREQGPNEDAMGAFGFLLDAHKWRNLQVRYREFMPVGIRPLLIPVMKQEV